MNLANVVHKVIEYIDLCLDQLPGEGFDEPKYRTVLVKNEAEFKKTNSELFNLKLNNIHSVDSQSIYEFKIGMPSPLDGKLIGVMSLFWSLYDKLAIKSKKTVKDLEKGCITFFIEEDVDPVPVPRLLYLEEAEERRCFIGHNDAEYDLELEYLNNLERTDEGFIFKNNTELEPKFKLTIKIKNIHYLPLPEHEIYVFYPEKKMFSGANKSNPNKINIAECETGHSFNMKIYLTTFAWKIEIDELGAAVLIWTLKETNNSSKSEEFTLVDKEHEETT